ncbi:MAG: hypothetical protein GPJ51_15130 [Candidatus Heimdallarchaeota archaeon]|nr:hypothetical protein [Candidatus Heimdallarchaeota archaeon]
MDFSELNCLKVLEPRASEYCLEILDKGDLDSVFPAIYCLGYLQCSDAFRKICIRLEEYIELCLRNSDWDGFAYYIDMCINTIFKLKGSDQNGYDKTDMRILLSLVLKIINKALNPVAHEFSEDNFKILINIVDNEEVYEHLIRVLETKEESGFAELLLAFDILYNLKRPELNLLLTKTVIHFIYDIEGFDSGDFYLKEIGKLEDENALELIVDSVGDRLYFVETIIKSNKVTSQNLKTWKKLLTKIDSQSKLVKLVENKINAFEEKK